MVCDYFKKHPYQKQFLLSIYRFFTLYMFNHVFSHVPFWVIRKYYLLLVGAEIGNKSQIDMGTTVWGIKKLHIGNNTHINRGSFLDARGGLTIGNRVSVSHQVSMITLSHNYQSPQFELIKNKIKIDDYVWIGANAMIVGNVHIGEGAVVCAGSVVVKDVAPYSVVAGVPAKFVKERPRGLTYIPLEYEYPFPMFV